MQGPRALALELRRERGRTRLAAHVELDVGRGASGDARAGGHERRADRVAAGRLEVAGKVDAGTGELAGEPPLDPPAPRLRDATTGGPAAIEPHERRERRAIRVRIRGRGQHERAYAREPGRERDQRRMFAGSPRGQPVLVRTGERRQLVLVDELGGRRIFFDEPRREVGPRGAIAGERRRARELRGAYAGRRRELERGQRTAAAR